MVTYFDILIKDCVTDKKNPIFFVRYEDLVTGLEGPSTEALEFLLDLESLEGTNCQTLVKELAAKGKEATSSYKLVKTTTGVPNAHLHRYTPDQMDYIKQKLGHILYFFGYTNHPTETNVFDFFKFDNHSEENLSKYYGFK